MGCRVIGCAGGARTCAWVTEVAGFDACLDRHVDDLEAGLRDVAPGGLDVVFDNVGGAALDAALSTLAEHAPATPRRPFERGNLGKQLLRVGPGTLAAA